LLLTALHLLSELTPLIFQDKITQFLKRWLESMKKNKPRVKTRVIAQQELSRAERKEIRARN
jgi:hypothetical protein